MNFDLFLVLFELFLNYDSPIDRLLFVNVHKGIELYLRMGSNVQLGWKKVVPTQLHSHYFFLKKCCFFINPFLFHSTLVGTLNIKYFVSF